MELSKRQTAYCDAVERWTEGMEAVSSGDCPGCEECAEAHDMTPEEHAEAWGSMDGVEASFSHSSCGVCGCHLGGDRHVWHWLDKNNEIRHEDDMCTDCVMYFANGDVPEDEYLDWTGEEAEEEI